MAMIDARGVRRNALIQSEICVIGAGAAGIALARELIGHGARVCLLESGGLELDEETQSLAKGENVGLPYYPLEGIRRRHFGGTTAIWTGMCRPLDETDFESRPWVPHSGWPFDRAHLEPFYQRAQKVCQLGPYRYDASYWIRPDRPVLQFAGDRVQNAVFQFGPPTHFGEVYRNDISSATNIQTYLHANVVKLETSEMGELVTYARVGCLNGNEFSVAAKFFVLATGAIENARLLLLSNDVNKAGLGNQNDLVGRFFAEHPRLKSGLILTANPNAQLGLYRLTPLAGFGVKTLLVIGAETQRREQLPGFSAVLGPHEKESPGVASAKRLYLDVRRGNMPKSFLWHLKNVIWDIDDVARVAYNELLRKPAHVLELENLIEPVPNPSSRVMLGTERDALGKPRIRLDWRLTDGDLHTIVRAQEIIAHELGRTGLGRLKIELDPRKGWPESMEGAYHHMGMTRMQDSPKLGVVDRNCRVHGIRNLFVAGSSVFPTTGYANPTLTIVALAIRLAEHLKRLVGGAR